MDGERAPPDGCSACCPDVSKFINTSLPPSKHYNSNLFISFFPPSLSNPTPSRRHPRFEAFAPIWRACACLPVAAASPSPFGFYSLALPPFGLDQTQCCYIQPDAEADPPPPPLLAKSINSSQTAPNWRSAALSPSIASASLCARHLLAMSLSIKFESSNCCCCCC